MGFNDLRQHKENPEPKITEAIMAKIEVKSEITGKVWKIERKTGDSISEDDTILILESMKMEIPVAAPTNGTLIEILVAEEEMVEEDQIIALMDEA